jgi:hypothetical protein
MSQVVSNPWVLAAFAAIAGAICSALVMKFLNKSAVFGYWSRIERLALAGSDPIWGAVEVLWQGQPVSNLYVATIEIENKTSRDFDDLELKVFSGQNSILLNEFTSLEDTTRTLGWTDEFSAQLQPDANGDYSEHQRELYRHNRHYKVPVLNRGHRLTVRYLCTENTGSDEPRVYPEIVHKGITLKYQANVQSFWGVPVPVAIVRGLILCVMLYLILGVYVSSVWVVSGVMLAAGLFAQALGAIEYRAESWLRKALLH